MRRAGIREARQNLSVLLQFVADGHEILITDRGRPVARLVAPLPLSPKPFPDRATIRRAMPRLQPPVSSTLVDKLIRGRRRIAVREDTPGPLYLDGSSLAKLYLPEEDSESLARALTGRRDLTISDLSVTEVMTGFGRRLPELGRQRAGIAGELHQVMIEDLEGGAVRRVELSPATFRAAERLALSLANSRTLRPRQLLHLALALTAGVAAVVTFDADLAATAESLGLPTFPGAPRGKHSQEVQA